tara:strand:- start:10362 stop:10559 length:198 start_codon:yes stop_codon:yes gene_type:complete
MSKFKSRKFWFAILGAVMPMVAAAMTQEVPWNEAMMSSVAIVMSYIFGQGYVDASENKKEDIEKE